MTASFACALEIAGSSPALGVLLAVPALARMILYGRAIARGTPAVDVAAAQRVDDILRGLGATEALRVVVQDKAPVPMLACGGRRPLVLMAASFVARHDDDDVLRPAAALALAEIRSKASGARRRRVLYGFVAGGLVLGFCLPVTGDSIALLPIAGIGLVCWAVPAAAAALMHRSGAVRRYADVDAAAVGLTGDPAGVARALSALASWREASRAERGTVDRTLARLLAPLPPDWHERARADGLSAATP